MEKLLLVMSLAELPDHPVGEVIGELQFFRNRACVVVKFGTIGASLQTLVGGDITLFSDLCEETRQHAFDRMIEHAAKRGANAVIGIRYDATEVMQSVTEVLCYGTAVRVQPL